MQLLWPRLWLQAVMVRDVSFMSDDANRHKLCDRGFCFAWGPVGGGLGTCTGRCVRADRLAQDAYP